MKIRCPNPNCTGVFNVDEAHIGKSARCEKCGTRFVIQQQEKPTSSPPVHAGTEKGPDETPGDRAGNAQEMPPKDRTQVRTGQTPDWQSRLGEWKAAQRDIAMVGLQVDTGLRRAAVMIDAGDFAAALSLAERGMAACRELMDKHHNWHCSYYLARCQQTRARALAEAGRHQEAIPLYVQVINTLEGFLTKRPLDLVREQLPFLPDEILERTRGIAEEELDILPEVRKGLAIYYNNMNVSLQAVGDLQASLDLFDREIQIRRSTGFDPNHESWGPAPLARCYRMKAGLLISLGRLQEGCELLDKALDIYETSFSREQLENMRGELGHALGIQAFARLQMGDTERGCPQGMRALELLADENSADDPAHARVVREMLSRELAGTGREAVRDREARAVVRSARPEEYVVQYASPPWSASKEGDSRLEAQMKRADADVESGAIIHPWEWDMTEIQEKFDFVFTCLLGIHSHRVLEEDQVPAPIPTGSSAAEREVPRIVVAGKRQDAEEVCINYFVPIRSGMLELYFRCCAGLREKLEPEFEEVFQTLAVRESAANAKPVLKETVRAIRALLREANRQKGKAEERTGFVAIGGCLLWFVVAWITTGFLSALGSTIVLGIPAGLGIYLLVNKWQRVTFERRYGPTLQELVKEAGLSDEDVKLIVRMNPYGNIEKYFK